MAGITQASKREVAQGPQRLGLAPVTGWAGHSGPCPGSHAGTRVTEARRRARGSRGCRGQRHPHQLEAKAATGTWSLASLCPDGQTRLEPLTAAHIPRVRTNCRGCGLRPGCGPVAATTPLSFPASFSQCPLDWPLCLLSSTDSSVWPELTSESRVLQASRCRQDNSLHGRSEASAVGAGPPRQPTSSRLGPALADATLLPEQACVSPS